jgi:2-octaprenyl-6-methoxyphenol hydroxylase
MRSKKNEIVIIGGGPVGTTLALALQQQGQPVAVLEARSQGAAYHDQRALALSYGSRLMLERLDVWDRLVDKATPIETIHISQRGSVGRSRLTASEHGQPALGYVLAYGDLSRALEDVLVQGAGVRMLHEAEALEISPDRDFSTVAFTYQQEEHRLKTSLLVLADGGRSLADIPGLHRQTKLYGHDALVTKVKTELPHNHIAYERFTPMGPVALLPNGPHDFSLVWTGREHQVAALMALPDDVFLTQLHAHFGDRVGAFLEVGKRLTFPLKLSYLSPVTASHLVVIGNAAQTMHPVAGQGFNVGLRDAWELAQLIADYQANDLGGAAMLSAYQKGRQQDTKRGMMFTDFLVNLFSNNIVGLNPLRSTGIGLLDILHPIKRHIVNKMSFGSRG